MHLGLNRLTMMNAMSSDPRLAALPALRKRAEEEARDIWDRHVRLFRDAGWDVTERPTLTPVDGDEPRDVSDAYEITVVAQLERLADLSRPESRRELAAMVAERIGWDAFDVTRAVESSTAMLAGLYRAAGLPELPRWEPAPTPAEALTLIAISTLTTTD
jgi:hypothetical protein